MPLLIYHFWFQNYGPVNIPFLVPEINRAITLEPEMVYQQGHNSGTRNDILR
jgi:hypothetical protein